MIIRKNPPETRSDLRGHCKSRLHSCLDRNQATSPGGEKKEIALDADICDGGLVWFGLVVTLSSMAVNEMPSKLPMK